MLANGWDNTACVVDGRWLFRFQRREIAVPGMRREIAILPRLAAMLPLPIPGADLLSAYGRTVSAERELAARSCAISLAASLAEYAVDQGGLRFCWNAWPD